MQDNGASGGGGGGVRPEDVITKLKDDGDFDRLRVKIIRKLKENEELRSNIISMVRQSATLNRPGAETMKPRQLSDAIHQEIGDRLMSQVSDCLWNVIRSPDGMKTEITETVKSVYEKITNPPGKENGESSSHQNSLQIQNDPGNNLGATLSSEIAGTVSNGDPTEPPGFALAEIQRSKNLPMKQPNNFGMYSSGNGHVIGKNKGKGLLLEDSDFEAPPGFPSAFKKQADANDEDPDVPPGFG